MNEITISGPEEDLRNFQRKTANIDGYWTLQSLVPEPELTGDAWYWWRVNNWGTKWDIDSEEIPTEAEIKNGSCQYRFDTAWGPPIEWFREASDIFPTLQFKVLYAEPGMDFAGEAICCCGEITQDKTLPVEDVISI